MYRFEKTKSAFSLIEIMLAMVIVAALMIAMVPGITKRLLPKKREQTIYPYWSVFAQNRNSGTKFCAQLNTRFNETKFSNGTNCNSYGFTVPENVYFVNITLVAGGGGGGSAGVVPNISYVTDGENDVEEIDPEDAKFAPVTREHPSPYNASGDSYLPDFIRVVKIKYLATKGKDGGYASTSGTVKGGDGGNSSPVIYEHILPAKYMFGLTYKTPLDFQESINMTTKLTLGLEADGSAYVTATNNNSGKDLDTNGITYRIDANTHAVTCKAGTTTYGVGTTGFNEYCGIKDGNLIPSVPGGIGSPASTLAAGAFLNDILSGGKGGKTNAFLGAGSGGNGQDAYIINTNYSDSSACGGLCPYTRGTTPSVATVTNPEPGKLGGGIITTNWQSAATPGGGGGSGAFIRLLNVPVIPGEKYTVYVGGGGHGGKARASFALSNGAYGFGGVSTSIVKNGKNGNELMYLVTGGYPGRGGNWLSYSSAPPTNIYQDYKNKLGAPGRNYHLIFSSKQSYFDNIKVDESLMTLEEPSSSVDDGGLSSVFPVYKVIRYKKFDEEPYKTFNRNFAETDDDWDKKIGGFHFFSNNDGKSKFVTGSYGTTYDGLYIRMLIDERTAAYIGGGGGFSPVDGRAVCPPFFMGNFDGRQNSAGTTTSQQHKNTFTIAGKTYKITDYFDNCNISTADGQDGTYILPDMLAGKFGSAGQGGPGGGTTKYLHQGSGGAGAPGYAVIDWTR